MIPDTDPRFSLRHCITISAFHLSATEESIHDNLALLLSFFPLPPSPSYPLVCLHPLPLSLGHSSSFDPSLPLSLPPYTPALPLSTSLASQFRAGVLVLEHIGTQYIGCINNGAQYIWVYTLEHSISGCIRIIEQSIFGCIRIMEHSIFGCSCLFLSIPSPLTSRFSSLFSSFYFFLLSSLSSPLFII